MQRIGKLAASVLAGVSSKQAELKDGVTAEVGVIATTAVTVGKQNETEVRLARSLVTHDIVGDGEGFGPSIERVDRSR